MAAAPHLFDDAPVASPELALVDADLAARLRADMPAGESFQPRNAARPELTLVFDAVVRDLAEDAANEIATGLDDVEEDPVAEWGELSDLVTPSADVGLDGDAVPDVDDDMQAEPEPPSADTLASPALESLPSVAEEAFELPDYIVVSETAEVLPEYVVEPESDDAPAPPADSGEDAVLDDELVPDYVALPDYVVQPEAEDSVAPAVPEPVDVMPEYVVRDDVVVGDEVGDASADDPDSRSTYPVLPDLNERSDALEETDAALRRIREQLVVPPTVQPRPRVRRRFTLAAAVCAVAAVATIAAELELGVVHAPGFLTF